MAVLLLFSHQKNAGDKFIHNFWKVLVLKLKKKLQTHGVEAIFIPVSANRAAAKDGDFGKCTVLF